MGVFDRVHRGTPVGIFNDDAQKVAFGLLSGVLPGGMGMPPARGTPEYLRAYSSMPWLRAVTGRISNAVARADWQLFVLKPSAGRASRTSIIQRAAPEHRRRMLKQSVATGDLQAIEPDHPLLRLLNQANEFQTGYAMRKVTQLHLDLVGDSFWLKERDGQGTPIGVWPIPPNWIMATPTPSFRFFRVSFRAWRGVIPDTEWVWFSDPDPLNPYGRGTGTTQAVTDELETDEYAARMTKSFFYNQAKPDLLIWPKGGQGITDANLKRLEEDWLSKTQGFFRAFKPYFMTREVEVKELDVNFRTLQFVQLREFERDVILQTFGVPPEILGVLNNSNRATIESADYFMSRYVVEPRLEFLRTVLQERFVPEFDEKLIIEYASPVQEDRQAQTDAAKTFSWALSMDEARALAGQKPLEDEAAGALHMLPYTMTPTSIEELTTPSPTPAPPLLPGGQPIVETPPAKGPRRAIRLEGLSGDVDAALDAEDVGLAKALRKATSLDIAALPLPSQVAARMEPGLARALGRAWAEHRGRVSLAALERALGPAGVPGDVLQALDVPGLTQAQTEVLTPQLMRGFLRGAEVGAVPLRRVGFQVRDLADAAKVSTVVDLAAVNPKATAWAQAHAAALVDAPTAVQARIRALIARANEEGIPPADLARLIRDVIGLDDRRTEAVANFRARLASTTELSAETLAARVARYAGAQLRDRALAISRTELIGALNQGQQALWTEAVTQGVIQHDDFEKVWLVTDDEALEEICEGLADERVGIDEAFSTGDLTPPAHVNCRCAIGLEPAHA